MTNTTPAPGIDELWEKNSISLGPDRTRYMSKEAFFASLRDLKRIRELREVEPVSIHYEWDTPLGIHRSFTYQHYNGRLPDRTIKLYSSEVLDLLAAARAERDQYMFLSKMRPTRDCADMERAELAESRLAKVVEALWLVLPMAKGYAAQNKVGSNQRYVDIADALLSELGKTTKKDRTNESI